MTATSQLRRRLPILGLILVAAIFAAYSNSLTGPFILDDTNAIVGNPSLRHPTDLGQMIAPPVSRGSTVVGRPLLNLSLAINYAISGTDVWSYHLFNLIIHCCAALVLFGLVRRTIGLQPSAYGLQPSTATLAAASAAAIWALHPLNTEAVTYIVQRAESLMGLFFFLTFYCFVRSLEGPAIDENPRLAPRAPHTTLWAAASVAACWAGMLTKENMAAVPLLVLLYDRTFVAGSFRTAWGRARAYYVCLAASWIPLTILIAMAGGNRGGSIGFGIAFGWWPHLLTQFPAIAKYLQLAIWPHPLVFEYGLDLVENPLSILPQAVLVAAIVAGTALAMARRSAWGFLGAVFLAVLAPTSLVPAPTQFIVEHRMYLPLAAILCGVAVAATGRFGRIAIAGIAGLALLFGSLTFFRNQAYASQLSIWRDTVAKRPGNPIAWTNLGVAYWNVGNWDDALASFTKALEVHPIAPAARRAGVALAHFGRNDEAARQFLASVKMSPRDPEAFQDIAEFITTTGGGNYADPLIQALLYALPAQPDQASALEALGSAEQSAGRLDDAIGHYRQALQHKPDYARALAELGNAQFAHGQVPDAIQSLQAAVNLELASAKNEDGGETGEIYASLGAAYLASDRPNDAFTALSSAVQLSPKLAEARYNLALIYASRGDFQSARSQLRAALQVRPDFAEALDLQRNLPR